MDAKKRRVVFMGTPEFAVSALESVLNAGYEVVGVVTVPDRQSGRGLKVCHSAVKEYALAHNLHLMQPEKLRDEKFLEELKSLDADVFVVVAFRMLPEVVWSMPRMGTFNLHASLLPQYRGAAPINWAIINGETTTGVTTFKLQHAIDTGNILLQKSFPIGEDETAGEVHDRMKIIGASLLVETLQSLLDGSLEEKDQSAFPGPDQLKHAPKLFTEDCRINWTETAAQIHNRIRGLSPFPGALTMLDGKILKLFKSSKELVDHQHIPGAVFTDGKTYLKFACKDGFIHLLDLQLEGKKRMPVTEFLRGYRLQAS